jgi:hypothetical protein
LDSSHPGKSLSELWVLQRPRRQGDLRLHRCQNRARTAQCDQFEELNRGGARLGPRHG